MSMRKVRLIYKANETYLKTSYPAYYYGSPDNRVYIVYSASYLTPSGKSGKEFFIARHEEFYFNYLENRILEISLQKPPLLNSFLDKPDLKFTNLKSFKSCKSYEDAEELLNKLVLEMIGKDSGKTGTLPVYTKAD